MIMKTFLTCLTQDLFMRVEAEDEAGAAAVVRDTYGKGLVVAVFDEQATIFHTSAVAPLVVGPEYGRLIEGRTVQVAPDPEPGSAYYVSPPPPYDPGPGRTAAEKDAERERLEALLAEYRHRIDTAYVELPAYIDDPEAWVAGAREAIEQTEVSLRRLEAEPVAKVPQQRGRKLKAEVEMKRDAAIAHARRTVSYMAAIIERNEQLTGEDVAHDLAAARTALAHWQGKLDELESQSSTSVGAPVKERPATKPTAKKRAAKKRAAKKLAPTPKTGEVTPAAPLEARTATAIAATPEQLAARAQTDLECAQIDAEIPVGDDDGEES